MIPRNLPYKISAEELYDIFGKYGSVRQIRKYVSDSLDSTHTCSSLANAYTEATDPERMVQLSWYTMTYMMPRTPLIISQDSMSPAGTSSFFITIRRD